MLRALGVLLFALLLGPGCSSPRPLDAALVGSDPALARARDAVVPLISVPSRRWRDDERLSSGVVVAPGVVLTAAHAVAGHPVDRAPDGAPALVGERVRRARVLARGEPDEHRGEWALLRVEGMPGRTPAHATPAEPVPGERCLVIGYPVDYLPEGWRRGMPDPARYARRRAGWRPPPPVVFETTVVRVGAPDGHRLRIRGRRGRIDGLSGGGAFVRRDGAWRLVGVVAHDHTRTTGRELGVTPLPDRVLDLLKPPPEARAPAALPSPTMAWITKDSAGTKIERRDEPYLTASMRDELVNTHLPRYEVRKGALFPALHMVQHHYGWIPHQAMLEIAEVIGITPAEVFDTVTFYEEYWTKPKGEHLIAVCRSIACEFCDATACTEAIKAKLGIDVGETTPDNKFTLVELECIGSCGTAPAALYNEDLHENLTPQRCVELIDQIRSGTYQHGGSGAVKGE